MSVQMTNTISGNSEKSDDLTARYYFIDWLRLLAIIGAVLFHVGMFFNTWGWHIKNPILVEWLEAPMDIAHRLRMPLLFVIAGAAVAFSLSRRGRLAVLAERSRRLLIPVLMGMLLIVPPQIYVERVVNEGLALGYWDYFIHQVLQFKPYPEGDFSWHHLWFIVYLWVYMLLLLPVFVWWKRRGPALRAGWWLLALSLPLGVNEAILRPLFPESHNLVSDWWVFNNYALLLCYGFLLSQIPSVWSWLQANRKKLLILMTVTIASILCLKRWGIVVGGNVPDAFAANIFVWVALLTMLGYGKHYLNRPSAWLMEAREFAYPLYILHQTLIILFAWPMINLPWSLSAKAGTLFLATMGCSWLIYLVLIRPFPIMRVLFGLPAQRKRPPLKGSVNESAVLTTVPDESMGRHSVV